MDPGPLLGGYLFIAVSGLLFVAIGVFASSLSRNQAVAGIIGFTMLFTLIFGLGLIQNAAWLDREVLDPVREVVDYAQIIRHREDFTRGVIDTRQLLFYLSGTVLALIFSILSVEAKLLHN
jgi:ABC-2 type transport system permease protein